MRYRRLGRTGLDVSLLSLGTGGPNRLGQSRYVSSRDIDRLLHDALDLGINLFDTSGAYEDSESLLGRALRGTPRERYYLSSKIFPWHKGRLLETAEIRRLVEHSLRRLRTGTLDLLLLHRVTPDAYVAARDQVLPTLEQLRQEGKFRFLGISESSTRDPQHWVLSHALMDDLFDAVMVTYHPAFTTAEQRVLPLAMQRDVGVIGMAAARHLVPRGMTARGRVLLRTFASLATTPPRDRSRLLARLRIAYRDLMRRGPDAILPKGRGEARPGLRLPESAYAFAVSHPAVASVLTGTTDRKHLERNVDAVLAPGLTAEEAALLRSALN